MARPFQARFQIKGVIMLKCVDLPSDSGWRFVSKLKCKRFH
ncbi:hypothetical protein A464_734 [Salmonella bongori N268-08]|uniref:Uncharacterized protein n=1 Tax=Salmonella bongori N268-08 TaxID=1197719 RepID=S5N606_SALBN|nr:hypothetical protein A464_734 [Salmonella bongori N268-08]